MPSVAWTDCMRPALQDMKMLTLSSSGENDLKRSFSHVRRSSASFRVTVPGVFLMTAVVPPDLRVTSFLVWQSDRDHYSSSVHRLHKAVSLTVMKIKTLFKHGRLSVQAAQLQPFTRSPGIFVMNISNVFTFYPLETKLHIKLLNHLVTE